MSQSQRPKSDRDHSVAEGAGAQSGDVAGAMLSAAQLRWVKIAIAVMTAMFAVGIPLLIGRIIYLARSGGTQAPAAAVVAGPAPPMLAKARLQLPPGAMLRSHSLSGGQLAVHFTETTGADGILILDLSTGAVLSRIEIAK